tara:strand:- start:411 stop:857 length:447 start_codon:yes stop_codon:yes gene_type:complete
MSRAGVLDTIDTLLGTVTGMSPSFVAVSRGEPLNIPAVPWCAFWVSGLSVIEPMRTLGDESTITTVTIRSWHPTSLDPSTNEKVTLETWNAIAGIRSALLGDAALSGNASQIQVNDASVENSEINGNWYIQTTQTLDVWVLGDTTITP